MRISSVDIAHVTKTIDVLWDKQTGYHVPSNTTIYLVFPYFNGNMFWSFQPSSWHLIENLGTCSEIMWYGIP
jgi:hypothetical protein